MVGSFTRAIAVAGIVVAAGCAPAAQAPVAAPLPAASSEGATASSDSADRAVAALADRYLALLVENSPEHATSLGIHDQDARLDDRTPAGFEAALAREERFLDELERVTFEGKPSRSAEIDLSLLRRMVRVSVRKAREQRPLQTNPSHYLRPISALFEMLARPAPTNEATARAAILRLEQLPGVVALAKRNLDNPSRAATEAALEDARGVDEFLVHHRPFLEKHGGDAKRARRAVNKAIAAYADYAKWLEKDLLPRSRGQFAMGRDLFEFLLREDYALSEDADEVYAIGKRAFDRAKAELEKAARAIDPDERRWPEVIARLKANHPTPDALVSAYSNETTRARAFLAAKSIVPFPPGEVLEVKETPEFSRATTQAAYDMPPPFDTTTAKGIFLVTPADPSWSAAKQEEYLREHGNGNIVDTVVHEAYPGHHLQVSFARLHPSVVRRVADSNIFCEGWGLYAEELMGEVGYYTPEERLFQLEWALVRAARVLIDVGLHTRSMTIDEAARLLVDEVHLEPVLAEIEARRYALSATQPLSYVLGAEHIRALRDRWTRERGPDLHAFHKAVLSEGSIPPALVEHAIFGAPERP